MTHYAYSAHEIDTATDAALECLAWTTPVPTEACDGSAGYLDGADADYSDTARARMREIVAGFLEDDTVSRLFDLLELYGVPFTPEQIGHDLILTANGHGAGFWDRDMRDRPRAALKRLSEIARPYGEIDAYVSDAGEIEING